jgi:hypothetical protein
MIPWLLSSYSSSFSQDSDLSQPVNDKNVCTFETLVSNSEGFQKKIMKFPTKSNQIAVIAGKDSEKKKTILNHAKGSRIIGELNLIPCRIP